MMKLAWLEDFLTLIEAGTFSTAARVRNVTQPAFSRRIQMLEDWLGVKLVDRRAHRLKLTATAARYEPAIRRLVATAYELRSHMRADSLAQARVALTTQHTLMVSHLPRLLRFLQERQRDTSFRVRTGNLEECVAQLARGEADLLLRFEAESDPAQYDTAEMERLTLGYERLLPVTARSPDGRPAFDPDAGGPIKLLSYPEDSFLGRVVRRECLPGLIRSHSIDSACESAFTVGLKEMVLAGMGVAWLPQGLIEHELNAGRLFSLHEQFGSPSLTVAVYRMSASPSPAVSEIWQLLQQEVPLCI